MCLLSMCIHLVIEAVACLFLGCESACIIMFNLLVTEAGDHLLSGGELTLFFLCTCGVRETVTCLFQDVSWPGF